MISIYVPKIKHETLQTREVTSSIGSDAANKLGAQTEYYFFNLEFDRKQKQKH